MAPEQLAGTRVTAAADMWSWAVTMVFAGTGELPFKGDSLTATAYAILHAEPQVGGLPEPLGSLVYRCLNKDAAGRPSARDVLAELVAAGARLVGPMPPMVSALAVDEEASSSPRAPVMPPQPRHGSGEGLIAARPASGPRSARHGSHRIRWRRRAPVLLAAGLLAAAVGVLAFILPRHGAASEQLAGSHTPVSKESPLRPRLGSRPSPGSCSRSAGPQSCHATPRYARTWSARASRPGTCGRSGLRRMIRSAPLWWSPPGPSEPSTGTGWPPSTPRPPSPASAPGPPGSTSCWSIPAAPPAYDADRQTALRNRKTAGAQLLANSHIKASAAARAQLLSGDVDPRLPQLLALMAGKHPVRIVDFVNQSPGGGPASLLRSVDLATVDSAAHMTRSAYLGWMQAFIDAQRAEYRRIRATGHAACWPNRAEDRVWRAEPAQLAEVRAGSAPAVAVGAADPTERQSRQSRAASGCVAGAPSRSPPYRREDAAGLQHADPGMLRKKQEIFSALGTIDEHR